MCVCVRVRVCVCVCVRVCITKCHFFFCTSLSLAGNSGHLAWVKHSMRKSSAIAIFIRVCGVFVCPVLWLPEFGTSNVLTDVEACD